MENSMPNDYVEIPIIITKHKDLSLQAKEFFALWLWYKEFKPKDTISYKIVAKYFKYPLVKAKASHAELVKYGAIEDITLHTSVGCK